MSNEINFACNEQQVLFGILVNMVKAMCARILSRRVSHLVQNFVALNFTFFLIFGILRETANSQLGFFCKFTKKFVALTFAIYLPSRFCVESDDSFHHRKVIRSFSRICAYILMLPGCCSCALALLQKFVHVASFPDSALVSTLKRNNYYSSSYLLQLYR